MSVQPQLLQIPLDPGDVVYTPDWVASDMVEFFKPSGRILDPCKGDGVFLKYLPPHTEWCEIQEGRDFFKWVKPVDWVFGNPPYKTYREWMQHSMMIANNIVYLLPHEYPLNSMEIITAVYNFGEIAARRFYGDGRWLGFPVNRPIAAFHFQRGYRGPMYTTIYGQDGS